LKAAGAYPVIAADPIPERRAFALRMGADIALDPTAPDFSEEVVRLTEGGVNVCIEVTGLGAGLITALDCMRPMGRVALLGCTRSSKFEIDYYAKVHGRGISLIGAHTVARPRVESSSGLWTDRDDMRTVLSLVKGGRLNFKDIISEIHSPWDANTVYNRLAEGKNFPIGVAFDWSRL
jgi:threonine dehydrogenase-like Zn-dependent dehydrogenase